MLPFLFYIYFIYCFKLEWIKMFCTLQFQRVVSFTTAVDSSTQS